MFATIQYPSNSGMLPITSKLKWPAFGRSFGLLWIATSVLCLSLQCLKVWPLKQRCIRRLSILGHHIPSSSSITGRQGYVNTNYNIIIQYYTGYRGPSRSIICRSPSWHNRYPNIFCRQLSSNWPTLFSHDNIMPRPPPQWRLPKALSATYASTDGSRI